MQGSKDHKIRKKKNILKEEILGYLIADDYWPGDTRADSGTERIYSGRESPHKSFAPHTGRWAEAEAAP